MRPRFRSIRFSTHDKRQETEVIDDTIESLDEIGDHLGEDSTDLFQIILGIILSSFKLDRFNQSRESSSIHPDRLIGDVDTG